MNDESKVVNYELAYRLIMLVVETTEDRHSGSRLNLDHARRILGAPQEEFDHAIEMLQSDMVLAISQNGTMHIG